MSDADGRVIPLTEDDQGEGIKDFFTSLNEEFDVLREKSDLVLQQILNEGQKELEKPKI